VVVVAVAVAVAVVGDDVAVVDVVGAVAGVVAAVVVVVVAGGGGGDEWDAADWPKESAQGRPPPQLYERRLRTWLAWLHGVNLSKCVKQVPWSRRKSVQTYELARILS
jgi:hypothetical protein